VYLSSLKLTLDFIDVGWN